MTPPTIAAVDGSCDDDGFPNGVDVVVDTVLLRRGINDSVAKDGVYVM